MIPNENVPSTFTKWAFVIFTTIMIGSGSWGFSRINATYETTTLNTQRIDRIEKDYDKILDELDKLSDDNKELQLLLLKYLAEAQKANNNRR